MRYLYRYQDKSGALCGGEVSADSEAEAYSILRKGGIRPMKVWPKPGFLNHLLIGKRWAAIFVLSIIVVVGGGVLLSERRQGEPTPASDRSEVDSNVARPLPRQQCPVVEVPFKYEAERVLAIFARPGTSIPCEEKKGKGVVSSEIAFVLPDLGKALNEPIKLEEGDSPDAVLLKRIVAGLKNEARMLVASGETPAAVMDFFLARQRMEVAYREAAVKNVRENPELLEQENAALAAMGIRKIGEKSCHPNGLKK